MPRAAGNARPARPIQPIPSSSTPASRSFEYQYDIVCDIGIGGDEDRDERREPRPGDAPAEQKHEEHEERFSSTLTTSVPGVPKSQ